MIGEIIAEVSTSILPNDMCIGGILMLVLDILVYGLGVAAIIGVVIAGILYMTARDNEAQVTKAKTRLYEIVIGLVAWALMFTVLNWLIPGGVNFGNMDSFCQDTSTSTSGGQSAGQTGTGAATNPGGGGGRPGSVAQPY